MQSLYERMDGSYTLGEDGMYYPDLMICEDEEPHYGKYGRMRKTFLKEHRSRFFAVLFYLYFPQRASSFKKSLHRLVRAEISPFVFN